MGTSKRGRGATVIALAAIALTTFSACGGGEGEARVARVSAQPLGALLERLGIWTDEAKPLIHQVEQDQRAATALHLEGLPLTAAQLRRISERGAAAGDQARASAARFERISDATFDEVKSVYCYAASQVYEQDAPPSGPKTFESFVLGYLGSRIYGFTPQGQVEAVIGKFRRALAIAHSEGPVAAQVAMARVCW